ncbi:MAG TPA: hypothetical protein VI216_02215, partial [Candidatus Acidoferrales bacterium]
MSPDGRQLAFAATGSDGVARLWIRPLDSLDARPLPGSESSGGFSPFFWSSDSKFVVFQSDGKLKKIGISGGRAQILCDASGAVVGGSWNRDGVIIFAEAPGTVMRVAADGGPASPLTTLDASRDNVSDAFPFFL